MSLDYFALDVDIASDRRIQRLIAQQGGLALSVYILLLTQIYSSEPGYMLQVTDEHVVSIAIMLRCKIVFVHEVIATCRRIGLFSPTEDPMLLTSPAIERRYKALTAIPPRPQQEKDTCDPDAPVSFPPSVEDVNRYLVQHNWDMIISAEQFHSYYSELNWSIHGQPLADWRSKVDKWVGRRLNPSKKKKQETRHSEKPNESKKVDEKPISASEFLKEMGLSSIVQLTNKTPTENA